MSLSPAVFEVILKNRHHC